MNPNAGDVVLVDVQFTDQSAVKQRPALVLRHSDGGGDFIVTPITSQSGHTNAVAIEAADFAKGSLPMKSWVRADRIFTVNADTLVRVYGTVKPTVLTAVLGILCPIIGCR
jgi:mRNA-degrading endonuclease toxin of MazEF toxin-antitoxin module